jgi:uncharacterized protein YoaH (UPF0181 family)
MVSLLCVLLSGALALTDPSPAAPSPTIPTPAQLLLISPDRRVRAATSRVHELMAEGLRRSPTFASLMTDLNRTDVIVYIEQIMTLPKETLGRLTIVPRGDKYRYLRIQIRADLPRNEAIALIAHEMRHALEVADDADVRDSVGLIRLYERIGHSIGGEHVYDTIAAQDTGRQVRRELLS